MHWMIEPLRRYADFSGRSRRMEYWMFTLLYTIVLVVCLGLFFAGLVTQNPGGTTPGEQADIGLLGWIGVTVGGLWVLVTAIPGIAVAVRRFHDQDKSGWMYLLIFIPYVGGLILLVFMCLDGTRGPNQYGPDPKGHDVAGTFS